MKTISIHLYEFNELSDKAKERARAWFRQFALQDEWWESIYEDAERIGLKIESFDLDRNRHATGKFISDAVECAHKIQSEHGECCESRKTADAFLSHRDKIVDDADCDEYGEFVDVSELDEKLDDVESEFLRDILEDYSIMLQNECEYLMSDESVDESILCNGYTFTENGNRMD